LTTKSDFYIIEGKEDEMTVKFTGPSVTKQDRLVIAPTVPTAFEDDHAEEYFVSMGWAEETNEDPVVTYPEGSVNIDPKAIFADGPKKGQFILPALAAAADLEQEG
jgi:hypothetical protein